MSRLTPADVDYLVIHCTAGSRDATIEQIRKYHTGKPPNGRGWSDIGYHLLVDMDGKVHGGRPLDVQGAQAQGFNARSLGFAWIGNHDDYPPTPEAWTAMLSLVKAQCLAYQVPVANVLGHRETYDALGQRRLKSCPGRLVDMDRFRRELDAWTDNPQPRSVA